MATKEDFISIIGVEKAFDNKKVLQDINLNIKQGEIVALLGRSGCGKSTLIKILVGYYKADSGEIRVSGNNISYDKIKSIVGYTTQENSFYDKLTVYENMKYYANLYNVKNYNRIDTLLRQVKLYEHKDTLAGNVSGGMKRRLDFAISLIHNPEFIILDEPTTGLDPTLVKNFWEIVTDIVKKDNISVLVTTHILMEVQNYCNKAFIMNNGKIGKEFSVNKSTDVEREFLKYA